MLKISFIIISTLLFLMFLIYKIFISKKKKTEKVSVYVSSMGGFLLGYVLCLLILGIYAPKFLDKILLLSFAISPFAIGKFATYEKENIYSYIQIIVIALSIFYVIIM